MKEYLDSLLCDYARRENKTMEWRGVEDGQLLEFSKTVMGRKFRFSLIWEDGKWAPLCWEKMI